MTEIETDVERRDDVALVRVAVENTQRTRQTVRLRSEVDGPVWPPRRAGTAAPDWQGDALEVTLEPGERRGVGFATPADPPDPPVVVESTVRAPTTDRTGPEELLGDLDEWAPPRSVLVDSRTAEER